MSGNNFAYGRIRLNFVAGGAEFALHIFEFNTN